MAGSRTLKLSILADVDDLRKKLTTADDDVQGFAGKVEKFGKVAGAAFAAAAAAAGAYAVKLAVDGVKAAIEDEAAQKRLKTALEAATGATNDQVKAIEDQILKTSLATGVADDQLRPAMQRLALATRDTQKAQELLTLALDISAATGKPLEAVTNALGKAYEGNTGALAKLGVGLGAAELKSLGLENATNELQKLFGGAAAAQAGTYQGQIARLQVAFDEAKETLGTKLLPIIQSFINIIVEKVIPNLSKFAAFFNPIKKAIEDNKETFQEFGQFLMDYVVPVLVNGFGKAIAKTAEIAGGVINVIAGIIRVVKSLVSEAIDGINNIIKAYNAVPLLPNIPLISKPSVSVTTPSTPSISTPSIPNVTVPTVTGGGSSTTTTPTTTAGTKTAAASSALANVVSGSFAAGTFRAAESASNNVTVNIGVAGDPEATARTIVDVLNQSSYRGTGGGGGLVGLAVL